MTTEKMNVHKALAELKILDDRIVKAINSVEACISNKHSNTKVKGVDIKVYTGVMKSSYDKATDLIKRREWFFESMNKMSDEQLYTEILRQYKDWLNNK